MSLYSACLGCCVVAAVSAIPMRISAEVGDTEGLCGKTPWSDRLVSGYWTEPREVQLESESYRAMLYVGLHDAKRLTVDVYNTIIDGHVDVARDGDRYYAIFNYQVHADTIGNVAGVRSLISAIYSLDGRDELFYCQEIVEGQRDIARTIAQDTLDGIIATAARAMK